MTLFILCSGDRAVRDAIARAERERDLADMCRAHADAMGDTLAGHEFNAEAIGWQHQIDELETRLA